MLWSLFENAEGMEAKLGIEYNGCGGAQVWNSRSLAVLKRHIRDCL